MQFYKSTQSTNLFICNELFLIGRFIVCLMFHEVEYVINVMYLSLSFIGQHVQHANCYGTFLKVVWVTLCSRSHYGTHIAIKKSRCEHFKMTILIKIDDYIVVIQTIIDCDKMFIDVYI